MSADALLAKLDGVRPTGTDRWLAKCPAHDDGRASLSIRELPDGRVLVHDFAGCGVEEVLAAVGLSFDDLFGDRDLGDRAKRERRPYSLRDLVTALGHELHVALIVLSDVGAERPVDAGRAALARQRICSFLAELEHAA